MAFEDWQISNIGTPDLIDGYDIDPSKRVWIDLLLSAIVNSKILETETLDTSFRSSFIEGH